MSQERDIYEMFDIVENAKSNVSKEIRIANLRKAEENLKLIKAYLKQLTLKNKKKLTDMAVHLLHNIKNEGLETAYREFGIAGINGSGNFKVDRKTLEQLKEIINEGKWREQRQVEMQQAEPQREIVTQSSSSPQTAQVSEDDMQLALTEQVQQEENAQQTGTTGRKNQKKDEQKTREYYVLLNHKIKMINEQLQEANGDSDRIKQIKRTARVDDTVNIEKILYQKGREVFYKPVGIDDNKNHICKWTTTLFFPDQLKEYLKSSYIEASSKHLFLQKNLPELFSICPEYIIKLD